VKEVLRSHSVPYSEYVFSESPKPDAAGVGNAVLHYDPSADFLIGVGSGVINDISKIAATMRRQPYMIVATAPSMDGYASETSSMIRDGLKVSVPVKGPNVILGDVDVLRNAPERMMVSGLGDMLAKYVSITEWRISEIINGEPFSEEIASLVRKALKKCVENRDGLLKRKPEAAEAVFEGLVIGGLGMAYAGCSRPASGGEHYMSHLIDMRSLEFGTPEDFHGIQCAVMTLYTARIYEQIRSIRPDREKALRFAASFDKEGWNETLRKLLKNSAAPMIELEKKEKKYDVAMHEKRLETIISRWDDILKVIDEELPPSREIEKIMESVGAPMRLSDIGIDESIFPLLFEASKDIRDKYVLSRLVWDLGIFDEIDYTKVIK
ncbi:MAG: sn-glycerol-1-phosphate dehydrogenase, partial [Lachnospiraceae bacterium]|nr:sn-glycerol-1-phosphate dehydrogenase [Lachnospiraceae bacterium]